MPTETEWEPGLLPDGAVLVHIGPYKTGTSAIQMALHLQRQELLRHGVLYPGTEYRLRTPGRALIGRSPRGLKKVPIDAWEAVVDEVRASDASRVCLSTESLAAAGPEAIARLIRDFGADRVHMVFAVRRLDKLLPSSWQQRVHDHGEIADYDTFLRRHLVPADQRRRFPVVQRFWDAQDPGRILERWRAVLPPEQIVLIVTDEQDRRQLHRTFEAMLGLPAGMLPQARRDNASFSAERAELQRRVNALFENGDWSEDDRVRFVRRGFTKALDAVEREPEETPIAPLPGWARERVAELSAERAEAVRTSGVRVIGDPDWLVAGPTGSDGGSTQEPQSVPFAPLAGGLDGLLDAMHADRKRRERRAQRRVERARDPRRAMASLSTKELLAEVARRGRARFGGR